MKMLKDSLNWDAIMKAPRYAGGHVEIMEALFVDGQVIASWLEPDYQGSEAFAYQFPGGRIVLLTDFFGSCSGCDSWEDATDDEVRLFCTELANNAHEFASIADAVKWIEENAEKPEFYGEKCLSQLVPMLRKIVSQ